MAAWHEVRIAARHPAADGLLALDLDIAGTPLVGTHTLPGQFVRVSLDGHGEGLFALASEPHQNALLFELLVQSSSPLSQALFTLPVGATLRISAPEGRGFPLDLATGHPVLLFATGSGISAIRSVVQVLRRRRGEFGEVTLYFGVRTPQSFAYADELSHWERDGIRVIQTVSRPGDSGWVGLTGHVQEHLPANGLGGTYAFLCGRPEMVTGVTLALTTRGMSPGNIFLNY